MYFLDIETIPAEPTPSLRSLFEKRFAHEINELGEQYDFSLLWERRAALFAEFGKVVCVSIGAISGTKLKVKSICGTDEKAVLEALKKILEHSNTPLCAHFGKEFDFPFLFRRYIINGM